MVWTGVALTLVAAYALPALGWAMNGVVFGGLAAAVVIAGAFALVYVLRFPAYRAVYRTLLTANAFAMNTVNTTQVAMEAYQKKIETDLSQTSHKSGYPYFNELFMKRHSKLLTKSAKKLTVVLLAALAASVALCLFLPGAKEQINGLMLTFLPYFLFVMYLLNRGRAITQAMFTNCDHSMLTYRFYRQPKVILALFTERLKYIVAINLLPASVIALGLPLLLWLSG